MKILILHPDFKDPGGVAAYYRKLAGKFSIPVDHLFIGTRPNEHGRYRQIVRLVRDLFRFIRKIDQEKYAIVHVNPSLDPKSLFRDGVFILVAKLWRIQTLVFFRGWLLHYENQIQIRWRWLFRKIFSHADAFIVLSHSFRQKLAGWVDAKPIYKEFTALDDEELTGVDIRQLYQARMESSSWRILFISRIIKEKGIYETIDAVHLLAQEGSPVELIVAGDGPELVKAREYAAQTGFTDIQFTGYVRGEAKTALFRDAHLLCLPTSHGEGMPNAVVEAMGFGLPIITRPAGGIADFFESGIHGFMTRSNNPRIIADLIRKIMENSRQYRRMTFNNYRFAQLNFSASRAAGRLEQIYFEMLTKVHPTRSK